MGFGQVRQAKETGSISVAAGLVLVLAWGPALHNLPSPAGVGFFMGNHGNIFVSEAWPHLPPGFSLQQWLGELLLSPCTSQVPADCGPWPALGWGSTVFLVRKCLLGLTPATEVTAVYREHRCLQPRPAPAPQAPTSCWGCPGGQPPSAGHGEACSEERVLGPALWKRWR